MRIDLDQFAPAPRKSAPPSRASRASARYLRIAEDLGARIVRGEIGHAARLPTTRALARRLRVNRHTVVAAYQKLGEWGLIQSHVGRGTFAVTQDSKPPGDSPDDRAAGSPGSPGPTRASGGQASAAPWAGAFSKALEGRKVASLAGIPSFGAAPGIISLAGSFPALDLLPIRAFSSAMEKALRAGSRRAFAYGPAQGHLPLRRWIAADMTRRGTPTAPEEILVTSGSQQAIDLIARAFTDPGDMVLLENPTYSGAISAFESFGARLAGLPLDAEGLIPGTIAPSAARGRGKLLYTAPSFQNPTTAVVPAARRRRILEEAASAGLLVIEDDWASGLRFEGEEPPTLRSLDADGRVLYLSTFAKKLIPGLRIGWIAAARPIIERLVVLKQISDCCTSPFAQAALEEFCRAGGLDRHLPRVRSAYRKRRDRMLAAMASHFPAGARWTHPQGGLFLWVRLPDGLEGTTVQAEAERRGVLVSPAEVFTVAGSVAASLRLTFASSRPSEIDRGIRILAGVLKRQIASAGRRRSRPVQEDVPLV